LPVTSLPTGTVCFLMTDIEGSTRLAARLGSGFAQVLDDHFTLLDRAITANDGTVVSSEGDAVFAVFGSARQAINAAVEAQRALAAHAWPADEQLKVRMGANAGEALLGGRDYTGLEVHRTARIAAAAWGGQILVSEAVRALAGALDDDVSLRDLGPHQLRDMPAPEDLFQVCAPGLPTDFPPPRTAGLTTPTNLPSPMTRFVGRRRELAELRSLVESQRLVTLTGPGGTGKTRLAVEAARSMTGAFPDGVWFVALDVVRDPALVVATIAQVLNVPEQPGRPLAAVLAERLSKARSLLVLDNLEQVVGAAPEIGALLAAAPDLRVLGSSREPLRIAGEHVYAVAPLSLPAEPGRPTAAEVSQWESVELFVERARAVRPDFELNDGNAADVAAICRRVDGLPLAIELAAARVNLLAPAQILSRLDHRLTMLASSRRDLPDRQRTLRGAIDWSHDLLSPGEQAVFRRAAVFVGGADLDGLLAVIDPDAALGTDPLDLLSALVDRSLIRSQQDSEAARFEMLETIREYAAERLAQSGEESATSRHHAVYFADLAEASRDVLSRPDRDAVLDRLDVEMANLRAAVAWTLAAGEPELGLRIVVPLKDFWHTRSHLAEARAMLDLLIAASNGPELQRQRGEALGAAAELANWHTDYVRSAELTDEWIALLEAIGDRRSLGQAKVGVGWSNLSSRPAVARDAFAEAAVLAREFNEPTLLLGSLQGLSLALLALGENDEARTLATEAITVGDRSGDSYTTAFNFLTLGVVALRGGDLAGAGAKFGEALRRSQAAHADIGIVTAFDAHSELALTLGDPANAMRLTALAERMRAQMGGAPSMGLVGIEPILPRARPLMDPSDFERAVAEGAAMTTDAGVGLAFSIGKGAAVKASAK
jgi:predicted ATPase/class 3 adenylate cyclase